MSQIGGYRSPVDLGLGRTPQLSDREAFDELVHVYNAIHLLNGYLDNLRNEVVGGGSGQTPAQTMLFNRFFVAKALVPISAGMPVAPPIPALGLNGVTPGTLPDNHASGTPNSNFCGVALTGGEVGEDIRVGVGPGVIEFAGAVSGQVIWAYSSTATNGAMFRDGGLYIGNPGAKANSYGTAYAMPVAVCISSGYIQFGQFLQR